MGSCHAVSRGACHPSHRYGILFSVSLSAWTARTHRHPGHKDSSWTEGLLQDQEALSQTPCHCLCVAVMHLAR